MAREIQGKLEAEADRKGLTGERRKRYIGGAWNRIRGKEQRSRWRYSDDARRLGRFYGEIHDMRELRGRPGEIAFRQGAKWYHVSKQEYHALNMAAAEEEHREIRAREREARAIREYERALAQEQRQEARRARQEQEYTAAQERVARQLERAQHADVRRIIRDAGGIRRGVTAQGHEEERGEYNRNIPADLRARRRSQRGHAFRQGITADEAATRINEQVPWLKIETSNDLYDYFERQQHRRWRAA